jgi:hypothetical protein
MEQAATHVPGRAGDQNRRRLVINAARGREICVLIVAVGHHHDALYYSA